jgi:hypothetical protein
MRKQTLYKSSNRNIKGVYRRLKVGEKTRSGDCMNAATNKVNFGWVKLDAKFRPPEEYVTLHDTLHYYRRIHCKA